MTMYADDSTLCISVHTASELTATLSKELQSVSEWVINNKPVLKYIYNQKHCIWFKAFSKT
jgi:hypothetical protein